MDGTDVQDFYLHESGLEMLWTPLRVDSIAESEALINTYSAEFGGTGAAINVVTKAGKNYPHGA